MKTELSLPPLDQTLFKELHSILFFLTRSDAQAAKVLGVSAQTFNAWRTRPPKMRWWNYILNEAIKAVWAHSPEPRKQSKRHKAWLRAHDKYHSLNRLTSLEPHSRVLPQSTRALARALSQGPRYYSDLRHLLPYSPRALRLSAEQLGVIKRQVGYGEDKDSLWEWPE